MSIKKTYGIYLAYPPTVKFQHGGLSRYLAAFLKAATKRNDIKIIVACPSWFKEDIHLLCKFNNIPEENFEIVTPSRKPFLLMLYEKFVTYQENKQKKINFTNKIKNFFNTVFQRHMDWIKQKLAIYRHPFAFMLLSFYIFIIGLSILPFLLIKKITLFFSNKCGNFLSKHTNKISNKVLALTNPKGEAVILQLYKYMEDNELNLLINIINKLSYVKAWYSPTAFWPSFNNINKPRLMCLPDIVLKEFPITFATLSDHREYEKFLNMEKAINGCQYFVTYSNHIKWNLLVKQYFVNPDAVNVVHHGVNDLSQHLKLEQINNTKIPRRFCIELFKKALLKSFNTSYTSSFMNESVQFIFYASQLRPSKNIITLLRAYNYLLKNKYIGHKLILTGNPQQIPEIYEFINNNNLQYDVLNLYKLSDAELSACYRLADLAINPSLSEGGFPFTFSEALSVDTPVLMAKIPVTEEILFDEHIQKLMLFDPYDWKNMAERIEWGLNNINLLREIQKPIYNKLSQRTWDQVFDDHINILDRISSNESNVTLSIDSKKIPLLQVIGKFKRFSRPNIKKLDKPLAFIHIPKTAGTAFGKYLSLNVNADEQAPIYLGDLNSLQLTNTKFKLYMGHLEYSVLKNMGYKAYYLTFLRDPLARIISQYKSWHKTMLTAVMTTRLTEEEIEGLEYTQSCTLNEYIMTDHPHILKHITDLQTKLLCDDPNATDILTSAKNNLTNEFYYFGILERFQDSINLFRDKFYNTNNYDIPKNQENRSRTASSEVSQEALERVRQLNQNDFALYDFATKYFNEIYNKSFKHAAS